MIGRTSTIECWARGPLNAMTRSMLSQSTMKTPARCSLASPKGPSVTAGTPPSIRTVFVFVGWDSPNRLTNSPDRVNSSITTKWSRITRSASSGGSASHVAGLL